MMQNHNPEPHQDPRAEVIESFVPRLRGLMDERGLGTAEKLAWFVGVTKGTAYAWLRGNSLPSLDNARQVARAFEVSLDYLAGETDERGTAATRLREEPLEDAETERRRLRGHAILRGERDDELPRTPGRSQRTAHGP